MVSKYSKLPSQVLHGFLPPTYVCHGFLHPSYQAMSATFFLPVSNDVQVLPPMVFFRPIKGCLPWFSSSLQVTWSNFLAVDSVFYFNDFDMIFFASLAWLISVFYFNNFDMIFFASLPWLISVFYFNNFDMIFFASLPWLISVFYFNFDLLKIVSLLIHYISSLFCFWLHILPFSMFFIRMLIWRR